MATNTPAKIPNVIRLAVAVASETPVTFHGAVSIIALRVQCVDAIALRVSFDEGGTFSTDNFWTIKSGAVWRQDDINWTVDNPAMWVRIPVSPNGDSIVEIIYWG